ncbi:MAG: hypothetical protein ACYC6Y_18775 [Thermoguttaceae bacterium]
MSINVTCPGCLKRFTVSEKFAGQKGPCPKCKTIIQIPKLGDEVVIHGGEEFEHSGRDAQGKLIGKPILREQSEFTPTVMAILGAGILVTVVVTWILGRAGMFESRLMCLAGLMVVSPALTAGGYKFLHSSEDLQPYRGRSLWLRAVACSLAYILLWGVFGYLAEQFLTGEIWEWFVLVAPFLAAGGFVGLICFDLDYGGGFLHYSFYVAVTILLRAIAGLGWIWTLPPNSIGPR